MLADTLTTAPEGLRDPELSLRLARRAVELTPDDTMCHQSLGWARYRAKDWKGCIEALQKTRSYAAEGDFFGAMALWHLGDKAKARDAFDRAETWLKGYEKKWEERAKKGVFLHPYPQIERRMRAEAAALLGVKPPEDKSRPKTASEPPGPPK
jgi:eukaryotic-like serine/threonine-protein kinase